MDEDSMTASMMPEAPAWLTPVAWSFVGLAVLCAAVILYDIHGRGHRQRNRVLELVWPITALYLGPLGLAAYYRWGRSSGAGERAHADHDGVPSLSGRAVIAGIPGGAASAVGHVVGIPLVLATGLAIAGVDLWAMILVIAVIGVILLFLFEYFVSTVPSRGLSAGKGAAVALAIATITVLAFDIGMGGWMLVLHFLLFMPPLTDVTFLFLMQIGLVLGSVTAYPAALWLVRSGTKAAA